MEFDKPRVVSAVRELLAGIGYDPDAPNLRDTPERVARMFQEVLSGAFQEPAKLVKVLGGERYDEMVIVKNVPFYSLCEHHLLPFHGRTHVAYLPESSRITGISKLARVVDAHARRLQVQERMTAAIADDIVRALRPKGVMVVVEAEHLCMTMRGVQKPGSITVTSVVRGLFRENAATRSEAMGLIGSITYGDQ
jgi:GTP cyclohydrolase I